MKNVPGRKTISVQRSWGELAGGGGGDVTHLETGKVAVLTEEGMEFIACARKEHSNALTFNLSVSSGRIGMIFICCGWGALDL